jgi:hypothetical protein
MFDKIDFNKLMEQDPAFKTYVQEVLVAMFTADQEGHAFLASVHGFYNIGMTVEQVAQWVRNMKAGQ